MNKELIKKAVIVHFACDNKMKCNELEESVDAAIGFYLHLCGDESNVFEKLIQTKRYKIKLELIKRYIKNHERIN